MTAPRIDAVRTEIRHTVELLHLLGDQLDDLHILAYNRHRASERIKVRGGDHDYALDNHGDKRARDLYIKVAEELRSAMNDLTGSIKEVRGYLTAGGAAGRRDGSADCTTDEVIAALDALGRRRRRGEYEPAPLVAQPDVRSQTEWRIECEALRSAVRKVTRDFAADHQTCQSADTGRDRFKRKLLRRYPTKNLSTRERQAWRNATQSVAGIEVEKAS